MKAERQNDILEYIKNKEIVKNSELEAELDIPKATLNRDLIELEKRGLIQRTHGGAMASNAVLVYEPLQIEKENKEKECKRAIGREAAKIISKYSSFIIDSGSTTLYLAREIIKMQNLETKVFATNDLKIAMILSALPDAELIVFGGRKRKGLYSMCGDTTRIGIENICSDVFFMSVDAVDKNKGITNVNFDEVYIKRAMMDSSKLVVLLADHTKFSKVKMAKVCEVSAVDVIITDSKTPKTEIEALRRQGRIVIVAGKKE